MCRIKKKLIIQLIWLTKRKDVISELLMLRNPGLCCEAVSAEIAHGNISSFELTIEQDITL